MCHSFQSLHPEHVEHHRRFGLHSYLPAGASAGTMDRKIYPRFHIRQFSWMGAGPDVLAKLLPKNVGARVLQHDDGLHHVCGEHLHHLFDGQVPAQSGRVLAGRHGFLCLHWNGGYGTP